MAFRRWVMIFGLAGLVTIAQAAPSEGASIYPLRPDDPGAVHLSADSFPVRGDGVADDSEALQQAINRVQETTVRGVVLVPEGRYRITRTVYVWSGIRLIGYGRTRPVIVLGDHTPGFSSGEGRYLLHFASYRPKPGDPVRDANPGTFYSGLSNINLEIGEGNTAAIGVRSHFAQHGFLAHVDFRTGSGRAGVEAVGNEIEDCRFFGGDYGILTKKPSPSWPFVLMDSAFQGQRVAAIRTEEAGMTIIRGHFADVPTVVTMNEQRSEELYIEDARFERIAGPALVISEEANARTQVNLSNVACHDVPQLVRFRTSARTIDAPGNRYLVRAFSHGLHVRGTAEPPRIETQLDAAPIDAWPAPVPSDVPALPPMETWRSIRDFGAVGDGEADDTEALRRAIAASNTVFLPGGRYRVSDTISLRPETVLVGLSPITTQLVLADRTPAFLGTGATDAPPRTSSGVRFQTPVSQGTGTPKPLLETPCGGRNIVSGLGLDTGINDRAVALRWRAGEHSLVNDVRFHGGHGTYAPDGTALPIYNNNRTGDADPRRRWNSQYWSLWVTEGGGGTFKNLWTPNPFAQAGLYVSDTSTPGRVYAVSSEHHVRHEVVLRRVANWRFYALQFEEERGEGAFTLPLEVDRCENLLFANLYLYRVMTTYSSYPYGARLTESRGIRFRGVHAYSPSKFTVDHTLFDATSGRSVRSREIAWAEMGEDAPVGAEERGLRRLAGGFNNIDGLAADHRGNVYFVDARWQRIYRWEPEAQRLRLLRDHPTEPVALVCDASGHVLVVTRLGTVYRFDPDAPGEDFEVLEARPAAPRAGAIPVVPGTRWRDSHDFLAVNAEPPAFHYVSPDGSRFIPAPPEFVQAGYSNSFFSTIDLIRSYGLVLARPGEPVYVADEFGQKTWRFQPRPDGTLAEPELFAEEGEGSVVVGPDGRVYVAAGDIFVYDREGRLLDRLILPERPTALVFGGEGHRALFIGARSSLYRWDPAAH